MVYYGAKCVCSGNHKVTLTGPRIVWPHLIGHVWIGRRIGLQLLVKWLLNCPPKVPHLLLWAGRDKHSEIFCVHYLTNTVACWAHHSGWLQRGIQWKHEEREEKLSPSYLCVRWIYFNMWCLLQDLMVAVDVRAVCFQEVSSDSLITEFKAILHQGAIGAQRPDC